MYMYMYVDHCHCHVFRAAKNIVIYSIKQKNPDITPSKNPEMSCEYLLHNT